MFTKYRRRRQLAKVKPGAGSTLQEYRIWQLFSRSLFVLELADRSGARHVFEVDVRHMTDGTTKTSPASAYVESLTGDERDAIAAYVNVDMVASPNSGYFVQGGVGDGEEETGPPGSARIGQVLAEELQAAGASPDVVAFNDGSDFVAFIEAGIPSGGMYAGDEGTKTAEQAARWGGTAGTDFDPCYHTACDRSDGLTWSRSTASATRWPRRWRAWPRPAAGDRVPRSRPTVRLSAAR